MMTSVESRLAQTMAALNARTDPLEQAARCSSWKDSISLCAGKEQEEDRQWSVGVIGGEVDAQLAAAACHFPSGPSSASQGVDRFTTGQAQFSSCTRHDTCHAISLIFAPPRCADGTPPPGLVLAGRSLKSGILGARASVRISGAGGPRPRGLLLSQ